MRRSWISVAPGLLVAGLLAVWASACATRPNPNLEAAAAQFRSAQADPGVSAHAPVALHEAQQSLTRAQQAFEEGEDEDQVDHLAYLASRRVEIARAVAERKAAVETTQQLGRERTAVVVDARTAEADRARAEARALAAELSQLGARETERGLVFTVGDVLFDVDRAELKPGAVLELGSLARFLREHPDQPLAIEGHADSTGGSAYNMELSRLRAEAVATVLIRNGVDPSRITTRGFGATMPVASNDTESGRQQNRRVEVVVLDPAPAGAPASAPAPVSGAAPAPVRRVR